MNIINLLVLQKNETEIEKRLYLLAVYIFGFNVIKRNVSPYRTVAKDPIQSNIDNLLLPTGFVTEAMFSDLRNQFNMLRDEKSYLDCMRDFIITIKVAQDGSRSIVMIVNDDDGQ